MSTLSEELWMPKRFPAIFRMYQLNLDGNADRVYWKYWDESAVHFVELMDENVENKFWKSFRERGSCIEKGSAVKSKPAMKKSEFLRRLGS